jgi:hypothetical protein
MGQNSFFNKIVGGLVVCLFSLYLAYRMLYLYYFVNTTGLLTVGVITAINTEGSGGMNVEADYCVDGQQYSMIRGLHYEFLYESIGKKYLVIYDKNDHGQAHLFYELALHDSIALCEKLDSTIDIDRLDLSFWAVNWSTEIVDIESVKRAERKGN